MNYLKAAALAVFTVLLLAGCARHSSVWITHPLGTAATMVDRPFSNTKGKLTAVVLVEDPMVVLSKIEYEYGSQMFTFFEWFYDSFAIYGKGINLCVHSMVAEEASQHGILTASIVRRPTVFMKKGGYVEHMSFDESDLPKLIEISASIGATHIIKGKWISGRRWTERVTRRKENQGLQIGNLTFGGGSVTTTTSDITYSTARVECTVYDVARGDRLFSREFQLYEEEVGLGGVGESSFSHVGKINRSLVDSILKEIEAQTAEREFPDTAKPSVVRVGQSDAVRFSWYEGNTLKGDHVTYPTLTTVERNGQVLKFNFTFANPTDAAMTVSLAHDSSGLATLARNATGEKFQATGSSASGDRIDIRAGERASFYFTVPTRGSSIGTVNFFTDWEFVTPRERKSVKLIFRNVLTP